MYSLTRSLMGRKLARMLIQVSSVVSTTSTSGCRRCRPCTRCRRRGSRGALSTKVKPPGRRAGSKDASSASERPKAKQRHDERHDPDEMCRSGADGDQQGAQQRHQQDERQDRHAIEPSCGDHDHEVDGHDDEREGDTQGVVLHASGLDLAQVAAGTLDDVTDAVDGAVDDGPDRTTTARWPGGRR